MVALQRGFLMRFFFFFGRAGEPVQHTCSVTAGSLPFLDVCFCTVIRVPSSFWFFVFV